MCITSETCRANSVIKTALNNLHQAGPNNVLYCFRTLRKDGQCTYVKLNIEATSRNHCCSAQAISITYSECVPVALGIQHTKRMPCIILSSVACPAVLHFSTLPHNRPDFRNKKGHEICVFIFCTTFV